MHNFIWKSPAWNSEPSSNDESFLPEHFNTLISSPNIKTLKSWNVKSWVSCPFTPFRTTWKNCPAVTKLQLHSQTSLRQLISDTLFLNKGREGPSREAFYGSPDCGTAVVILLKCSHGGKTNTVLPYLIRGQILMRAL